LKGRKAAMRALLRTTHRTEYRLDWPLTHGQRNKQGEIVGVGDMRAQILQVAENLRISLKAAGASFKDLVQTITYVTAIDEFFKHPDARAVIFGDSYPTSTTVEVRRLAQPELLVEIAVTAMVDQ
jgi:enamine deaminase RidA (YjgF/YER057c/UK114 family)